MTSVASTSSQSHPLGGLSAQQAARATYLKTGVDKDAAIGDPDRDGARKAAAPAVSAPASSKVASAVPTVNAVPTVQGTSANGAAVAYGRAGSH